MVQPTHHWEMKMWCIKLLSWFQCSIFPTLLGFLPSQPTFWNIHSLIFSFLFLLCYVCKARTARLSVKVFPSLWSFHSFHESNQTFHLEHFTDISWRSLCHQWSSYSLFLIYHAGSTCFFNLRENERVESEKGVKQMKTNKNKRCKQNYKAKSATSIFSYA